MTSWSQSGAAPSASLAYEYDAVGNVRRTLANYATLDHNGTATGGQVQDLWYRYDAMNRVVTQKGMLAGGQIVRGYQGVDYTYNLAGERVQATRMQVGSMEVANPHYDPYDTNSTPYISAPYDAELREDYAYTPDGQLEAVRVAASGAYDDGYGGATATGATYSSPARSSGQIARGKALLCAWQSATSLTVNAPAPHICRRSASP